MRKTRAEKILELVEQIKPGKAFSMTMYDGDNVLDAQNVESRMKTLCKTGELMPIPLTPKLGLDISFVQLENDTSTDTYKVIIEGVVTKMKEMQTCKSE